MEGDKLIIQQLNQVLYDALTAINQYFLHARMLKDWGLERIAKVEYKQSIHVMKVADKLIERILLLNGLPNLQQLGKLKIGENCEEIIQADLSLSLETQQNLKAAISACESKLDFVSRDLLEDVLSTEEDRIDWLETQVSLTKDMGLANYIQLQASEDD